MIRYRSTSDFSEILFTGRIAFSKRSWPYLLATAIVIPAEWLPVYAPERVAKLPPSEACQHTL